MGVGMMQLDERFVARFEAYRSKGRLDFEDGERLITRRKDPLCCFATAAAVAPAALPAGLRAAREHAEMVAYPLRITGAVAVTQLPARALPDCVVADLSLDLDIAHAGVIIPSGIVEADMFETKPVVVAELKPRLGRAKLAAGRAAGIVAEPDRSVRLLL